MIGQRTTKVPWLLGISRAWRIHQLLRHAQPGEEGRQDRVDVLELRSPHVQALRVERVPALVAAGFKAAKADAGEWRMWSKTVAADEILERWADRR